MGKVRKKRSIFSTLVPTNVGILLILLASVPVVLLANTILHSSQESSNIQAVEADSTFSPHGGFLQKIGSSSGSQNMPEIFHCPPGAMCKPFPSITCTPHQPQNASASAQGLHGNKDGCPPRPSISPFPSIPPGCFYRRLCETTTKTPCAIGNGNCNTCKPVLVCLSPRPSISGPFPSCQPTPTCNPKLGILCRPSRPCFPNISREPEASESPQPEFGNGGTQVLTPNAISHFFQSFFKGLFSR